MTARHAVRTTWPTRPVPRCIHVLALRAALAAGAGVGAGAAFPAGTAHALDVSLEHGTVEPGGRQAATVTGLYRGQIVHLAWIDPTGRARLAWDLAADRRGRAAVRFRAREAFPGWHRLVAWHWSPSQAGEGVRGRTIEAEAGFEVLPGEPPGFLAVLDSGDRHAAGDELPGSVALVHSGEVRPSETSGWLVRILEGGPPFLELDRARVRALGAAYRRNPSDELLARPVCLHDRSWSEQVWRWALPRAAHAARGRPWLWSLGRRVEFAPPGGRLDFCRSPQCMREFARHLRKRYGNVEKLNRLWRTSFADLAGARPPTTAEVLEVLAAIERGEDTGGDLAARLPGILTAWTEHRGFLEATWAKTLESCRRRVRSVDRRAAVGIEDVRLVGVFTGCDPARYLRALDWASVRPRALEMALVRSFALQDPRRRSFRALTEVGGARPRLDLWRGLAGGHMGAVLRRPAADDVPEGERRLLAEARRRLEGGLAALVSCSTWEPDPVAVLYSRHSVRVEWLANSAAVAEGGTRPPPASALTAWAELLSDIGMSAEFLDAGDVARKALRSSRARALILPRAYVLSRVEFREIRRFVRAGGLLVADAGTGLYDEAFTDALERHVADLFSIERPRRPGPPPGRRPGDRSGRPLELTGIDLPGSFIDGVGPEGLRVAEEGLGTLPGFAFARATGDGPGTAAIVSSPSGRGRAVYLNLALEHYPDVRAERAGANIRRLVRNALELAHAAPRVEVLVRGVPAWGCERNSWRLEETEVFTMWLDPAALEGGTGGGPAETRSPGLDADLVFERPGYCFDELRGVLLGRRRRIPVRLSPGPNVFVWMPYDVESISIRARRRPAAEGRPEEILYEAVVETTTGFAGTHVVSQDLLDGDGRRVPGASRIITAERGVAKGRVRMALNEPPGEYTLVLRDATTGVEGSILITPRDTELQKRFPLEKSPSHLHY